MHDPVSDCCGAKITTPYKCSECGKNCWAVLTADQVAENRAERWGPGLCRCGNGDLGTHVHTDVDKMIDDAFRG